MTHLLIARHGNTFDNGDIITRVGLKTDLPLSQSGQQQARTLGLYLKAHYPEINQVFCSELQRTKQSAALALEAANIQLPITPMALFNEIDYGVDENQPEEKVVQRIGKPALDAWDNEAILPKGWIFNIEKTKTALNNFLSSLATSRKTTLVITSNGIARFIPLLNSVQTTTELALKMPTGSLAELCFVKNEWRINYWGRKPML